MQTTRTRILGCVAQTNIHCSILIAIGATARAYSHEFGPGSGPILLDNVRCRGSEYRLLDCANDGFMRVAPNCNHHIDAGVTCVAGTILSYLRT